MSENLLLRTWIILLTAYSCSGLETQIDPISPYQDKILVGVITDPDDLVPVNVIQNALDTTTEVNLPRAIQVIQQNASSNDPVQYAKAVCNLLKHGVFAIFAKTNMLSYEVLVSFSNQFQLPFLSPAFPEAPPDLAAHFGINMQPNTVRAILDLLRFYSWKDIVYLYDTDHGPEKLQKIFQLGYRVLDINLLGILRISNAEQANRYLRKLESTKKNKNFHVILDLDPTLAKNVIVRHVHDVHVGKLNFHFLIAQPVLEEFWTSQATEFGSINVTGFSTFTSSQIEDFKITRGQHLIEKGLNLDISSYFFHDAALLFAEGLEKLLMIERLPRHMETEKYRSRNCMETSRVTDFGNSLTRFLKQSNPKNAISGKLSFDGTGKRKDFQLDIIESPRQGHKLIGTWSDTQGLKQIYNDRSKLPVALPRTDLKKIFKIISVIKPPFLMVRHPDGNNSEFIGNDQFEGYCKDLMDLLAKEAHFEYELILAEDNTYGKYDEAKGEWTGIIGEIIRGKADIAVADLYITARRQRVVDFLSDVIGSEGLSLLMKNPRQISPTSAFYFFFGFTKAVWICIIMSTILVILSFHLMAKFTGSPDNIEATSGIWGKKFTPISSAWFIIGSSLLQDTGIYPRSISCRILSGTWWCFTVAILALFIANTTSNLFIDNIDNDNNPQLARLSTLTLESILTESIANNWPKIGILRSGSPYRFIKRSSLPLYNSLALHLQDHSNYIIDTAVEGIETVRKSSGDYAFVLESSISDYLSDAGQCDTISIHDTLPYADYGIAIPLGSLLGLVLNDALRRIKEQGQLGHLRRKWWVDKLNCDIEKSTKLGYQNLSSTSGLFCLLFVGLFIAFFVAVVQYRWKIYKKEERRQRLSFEEVAMNQSLPLPPPELLSDSPEEDSQVIDGWAERKLVPTSFTQESLRSVNDEETLLRRN